LTDAVRQISGEDCEIIGASRTDSGAHARGQVCHFDTRNPMPPDKWRRALNDRLPSDLAVLKSDLPPEGFHSRFWADRRWYRYCIQLGQRDPLRARYCMQYPKDLDEKLMGETATVLDGEHDYVAFSEELMPHQTTVRTLYSVEVSRIRDEVRIDIVGTAFVRGMMRRISGALWEIGRGHRPPADLARLLTDEGRKNLHWPTVLPAWGLTLMKVSYGRRPKDVRDKTDNKFTEKEEDDE
jgi:tRNA pseudouridine38-40 synthase